MTLVEMTINNEREIKRVVVYGHSGYENIGKDIVCSAVSTSMFVSMGLIEKICPNYTFTSNEKNAYMELLIHESNEMTQLIVNNLLEVLEGIQKQYPKHLTIKFEK